METTANVVNSYLVSVLSVERKRKMLDTSFMETTKHQLMGMGLATLVLVGVLGWRIWGWIGEQQLLSLGKPLVWRFQLTEQVRESGFNCVVGYRGVRMLVPQKLCNGSHLLMVEPGDELEVEGRWQRSDQYGDAMAVTKLTVMRIRPSWWSFWWWRRQIEGVRQRLLTVYWRGLPEPEASLMAGIVVGEQAALPATLKQALQLTGTTHIVAASGFNVAVIVAVGLLLMQRWGRTWRVIMGGLLIWGYVLLCGASPPVVRAGLMGAVMLLGILTGREYWSGWGLLVVGLLMVIWQPWLLASVSFQLSMSATAGVIWGGNIPNLLPNTHFPSIWKQLFVVLFQTWTTTLAAMIMTAPISLMTFGQVSWWGLVVNPLVLWLIPMLMYLGLGFGTLGIIWLPLTEGLRWLVWPLATLVVRIIEVTGQLPIKPLQLSINWWMTLGWWCLWLGIWGWRSGGRKNV